jgi:hypothetical protein
MGAYGTLTCVQFTTSDAQSAHATLSSHLWK